MLTTEDKEKDPVLYLLVDRSLKMRQGKACAQVGHACILTALKYSDKTLFYNWVDSGQTKIVLKCQSEDLDRAEEEFKEDAIVVRDFGRTELEPNTRTVVALPLRRKDEIPSWIKELPLL